MFGKPLISQAVIRHKLAGMISRAESVQAWLENVTYQMCNMAYKEQAQKLAGPIAFLKSYSTHSAQITAADAVQIFGGRGITQTGMGRFVEHLSTSSAMFASNMLTTHNHLVPSHRDLRCATRRCGRRAR